MFKKFIFILTAVFVFVSSWAQMEVQIGEGTSTTQDLPANGYYNYAMSQVIYPGSEIGMACQIQSLSYYVATNAPTRNWEVYIAESSIESFSARGDALAEGEFTKVFEGSYTFTAGEWNKIEFETPFVYSGSGNIIVAVRDVTGSYVSNRSYFQYTSVSGSALYYRNDGTNPTFETFAGSLASTSSQRPNIKFEYVPLAGYCGKASKLAASATSNSALLSWNEGYSASTYTVFYKKSTETEYTQVPAATNSVTIENLDPASLYTYYVVSTCESGTSDPSAEFTFKTACLPTELPMTFGFDDLAPVIDNAAVALIPCWEFTAASNHPYISDDYAVSMENSMRFANNSYAVLPFFSEATNSVQFSAKMYSASNNYGVTIGVVSDPADMSTFEEIKSFTVSAANTWTDIHVNFRNYEGTGNYIAIKGNNNYVYIDDIVVKQRNACEPPLSVVVSSISDVSADVSWTDDNTNNSAWRLYYKAADAEEYSSVDVTAKTYTLTGLTGLTNYSVYVATLCSGEESEEVTETVNFSTPCAPLSVDELPYATTFAEVTGTLPDCWTRVNSYAFVTFHGPLGYDDNAGLELKGGNTVVAMNPINAELLKQLQLSFYHRVNSSNTGSVEVGYMTNPNDESTFVSVETLTPVYKSTSHNNAAYYSDDPAEIYFNNIEATGVVYPAFKYTYSGANVSWYIDVLRLGYAPTCAKVKGTVTVTDITQSSATVAFTDEIETHTAWKVYYQKEGSEEINSIATTEKENIQLTGLSASSHYDVWITAVCSADDESEKGSASATFGTTCGYVSLPFSENFDSYSNISNFIENSCWTVLRKSTTYPSLTGGRIRFYATSQSYYGTQIVVLPPIDFTVNPLFSLQMTADVSTANVTVGLMSDPNDSTTFVDIYQTNSNFELNFIEYAETIAPILETHKYLAIKGSNTSYQSSYLDNVWLGIAPTCLMTVSNITYSEVSQSGAKIAFEDSDENHNAWKVYYKKSTETEYEVIATTEKSVTLTGLNSSTTYNVYVTVDCGGDESYASSTINFTTACGSLSSADIPWSDGFENGSNNQAPVCWIETKPFYSTYNNENHNYPAVLAGYNPYTTHSGSACIEITGNNTDADGQIISTPIFENIDWTKLQLSFWYRAGSSSSFGVFEVGYVTDPYDASTYTTIQQITPENYGSASASNWHEAVVYLTSVPANAKALAFKSTITSRYTSLYVDDVTLSLAPTCLPPYGVAVSEITGESAKVTFEDANTEHKSWNVYYKQGSNDPVKVTTTSKEVVLNDLSGNTSYSVYVTTQCGEEDESSATSSVSFTTACGLTALPFYEGFNVTTMPSCWRVVTAAGSNNPHVQNGLSGGNNVAYDGNSALELKGGDVVYALPQFADALNTLRIDFYYRQNGTTSQNLGAAGTMEVGYITDLDNAESFVSLSVLDDFAGTSTGVMHRVKVPFTTAPAQGYMALRYTMAEENGTGTSWYIDGVTVELTPACDIEMEDATITMDNATTSSIDVTWTKVESAVKYAVKYRETGAAEWNTVTVNAEELTEESTTQTATVNGLNHSTVYEFAVAAMCNDNDEGKMKTSSSTLATLCAPVDLPWSEDFNNEVSCIEKTDKVTFNSSAVRFATRADDNLYTPEFNLEANKLYSLTYNYRTTGTATWFEVKDNLINGENVTVIGTSLANIANVEENTLKVDTFSVEQDGVYKLSVYARSNGISSAYLYIDDIQVKEVERQQEAVCNGTVYEFAGKELTETGIYYDTVTDDNGFTSLVELNLTVNPVYDVTEEAVICDGASYTFAGEEYSVAGTYTHTFTTAEGCDSVVTLTLKVNPNLTVNQTYTICEGSTYTWNGQELSEAGEYTYQTQSVVTGCDSTVTLTLSVNPNLTESEEYAICEGETYTWNGQELTESGEYTFATVSALTGCDSVVTLTLTVNPKLTATEEYTLCEGNTYNWNGLVLTEAGEYTYQTQSLLTGCDSTVTLTLSVSPKLNTAEEYAICVGGSYEWNGMTLTSAGVYTYKTQSVVTGCDSTVVLTLSVNPKLNASVEYTICEGETYSWNGQQLTEAGVYMFQTQSVVTGCDSTVILTLSVNPKLASTEAYTICEGETYTWNGQSLTTAGQYTYTTASLLTGCDSTVTLTLTVNPKLTATEEYAVCEGETYTWNGQELSEAGEYTYETQSAVTGCDSTVTLTLTVNPKLTSEEEYTVCEGETYTWNGQELSEAGEYTYTTQSSVTGCDSTVTLTLSVWEAIPETFVYDTVYSDTLDTDLTETLYVIIDSVSATLQSEITGCDSVVTMVNVHGYVPKNGLTDVDNNITVSVYPNPTVGDASLSVEGINGEAQVIVTDIQGRIIYTAKLAQGQQTLNIPTSSMSSGTYYIRVTSENGTRTQKLIRR